MYFGFAFLLSAWTIAVGLQAKFSLWDSIILTCWLAWPLLLVSILIRAREKSQQASIWRLRHKPDFLLVGGLIPLLLGQLIYNLSVTSNINAQATFTELSLYIGIFSVALWGVTGVFVFSFYILSRVMKR